MKTETALSQVLTKLNSDRESCEELSSAHEGYAFLKDEEEDLWNAIRRGERSTAVRNHAKRVAVMAMRIMTDCT